MAPNTRRSTKMAPNTRSSTKVAHNTRSSTKMALTERNHATTAKKSTSKTGSSGMNRVVKRPQRGFHRFRNGILNVVPKGGEEELFNTNQGSLLLRLPPELRRHIWSFALGGLEIQYKPVKLDAWDNPVYHMAPPVAQRKLGLDLLRTCRQIYMETTLIPYQMNTFVFSSLSNVYYDVGHLKPFQRAQIKNIQLCNTSLSELKAHISFEKNSLSSVESEKYALKFLPALTSIHIVLWCGQTKFVDEDSYEAQVVNTQLSWLSGRHVTATFEIANSRSTTNNKFDYLGLKTGDDSGS